MQNESPLVIHGIVKVLQTKTIFQQHNQEIVISVQSSVMNRLLKLCSGELTKTQIISALSINWDKTCVTDLVNELLRLRLLIDGRYICEEVWQHATNPSCFARAISDQEAEELSQKAWARQSAVATDKYYLKSSFNFGSLLEERRSTRDFSNEPVELQKIVDVLWAGYGECKNHNRTVPSAEHYIPRLYSLHS
jgi:hypothetical protein